MRLIVRLVGILALLVVVLGGSLLLLPSERIAKIAADQIAKQTGRAVTLEGETKITLWPILGVATERMVIANADWSDGGPMLTADDLKIGVEPQALWGGEVRITGLEVGFPKILLERAADGRTNWELGVTGVAPAGEAAQTAPNRLALTLDRALVEGAQLTYTDHASGESLHLSGVNLDLRWPDYAGAARFEGSLLPLGPLGRKYMPDAERIHFQGELAQMGAFIDGALTGLTAQLELPGGTARFDGQISTSQQAQGQLEATLSDTARALDAVGLPGIEIPAGMGRSLALSGALTLQEGPRIALRDMMLGVDQNRLTGGADLNLAGAKPRLSAQMRAGALDLSGFAGSDSNEGASDASAPSGWSTAPIDATALGLVDGEFALVADSINLGDLSLGKTRTTATLDRARLVFTISELQLYDGALTGEFVVNNRSGLSVGGNLSAQGLNIQTLLQDTMDISRLSGTAAAQLRFLGVGQNMDAIMRSLSGAGSVSTGRGVINGIDLDRLMRAGDLSGGTTVFDSLTASFTMEGGNVQNNDLQMSLPLASATGEGRIGLGARDIDYLFTPRLLEGENTRGLAIPVRISGPWSGPRIVPDLERAIDLNLQKEREALEEQVKAERDKLEQDARDEVNRALENELGVTVEEGQSVEDALQDAIEKELGEGLLNLFD